MVDANPFRELINRCKACGGAGYTDTSTEIGGVQIPSVTDCECTRTATTLWRMERAWPGMAFRKGILSETPLSAYWGRDLYVDFASEGTIQDHLKAVLWAHRGKKFSYRVTTDADLIQSIFTGKKLDNATDHELTPDEDAIGSLDLAEEVLPPDLLVLRLGVKQYRNRSTPEAVLEALTTRAHRNKRTWVLVNGALKSEANLSYSSDVAKYLDPWPKEQIGYDEAAAAEIEELVSLGATASTFTPAKAVDLPMGMAKRKKSSWGKSRDQ